MSKVDKVQVYFPEKVYKLHGVNLYHFAMMQDCFAPEREMKTAGAFAPAVGDLRL